MLITLESTWQEYLETHTLAPKTISDHYSKLKRCIPDWMNLDMNTITPSMVLKRHKLLSVKPTQANCVFRIIRTLFNFAIDNYEDEKEEPIIKRNPVNKLSKMRAWNKERPRHGMVPLKKLGVWADAIVTHLSETIGDYLLTLVVTGLRKQELATLKWEYVDFENGFITIPKTKNGKPHVLPITRFMRALLRNRRMHRTNEYVFPGGRWGTKGCLQSPYKAIARIRQVTGIPFAPHDLRRTFNKLAEKAGVEEWLRKRMLNHTPQDVTGKHYSVPDPEDLREPMEKVSMSFLEHAALLAA